MFIALSGLKVIVTTNNNGIYPTESSQIVTVSLTNGDGQFQK